MLWPGEHEVVLDFSYDGGPPGSGGLATILIDGAVAGREWIAETTAYYFAFDETFNVGIDRGSPVVDDYPPVRNALHRRDPPGRRRPRRGHGAGRDGHRAWLASRDAATDAVSGAPSAPRPPS